MKSTVPPAACMWDILLQLVSTCGVCVLAQEYAGCLPQEAAANPCSLGAWLYSCVGVSHAEEAALRLNLPSLTVQVRCTISPNCTSNNSCRPSP